MLKVVNDDEFKKENNITTTLPLKRLQLDYSPRVIEYIQRKKKADIENLYDVLSKRRNPQEYRLSVYLCDIKKKLYHVYGQEQDSIGNAFILGALLLHKSFKLADNKISIIGVIHADNLDKRKFEISNLKELFEGYVFRLDANSGDIIPVFSLEGSLLTNLHKNKPIRQIKHKLHDQKIYHITQKRYNLPRLGCPEGFKDCISNCNYIIQESQGNIRCGFICKLGNELQNCNESCAGYLKLSNDRHSCRYEFSSSCGYNIKRINNV